MELATAPSRRPTTADLTGDNDFAKLARANWLTKTPRKVLPSVVEDNLWTPLVTDGFPYFSLVLLEQLQTLERYLWPGYTDDASDHHVLLIALLVNVKRQEQLPTWTLFADKPDAFQSFFQRLTRLSIDQNLSTQARTHVLEFVVGAFQSLDSGLMRKECAPLVGIGIWGHLHSEKAREQQLAKSSQLQKAWRAALKKFDNADSAGQARLRFERSWIYTLTIDFLDKLYEPDMDGDLKSDTLVYCETFIQFLCDLQSQLPTRRYVNALLQDLHVVPAIRLSPTYETVGEKTNLKELLEMLSHYTYFPIVDQSGQQMSRQEFTEADDTRIATLQKVAMRIHPDKLKILVLANFGSLGNRSELASHLEVLSDAEIAELSVNIGLRTQYPDKCRVIVDRKLLLEALVSYIERKPFYTDVIQHQMDVLPTEKSLYELTGQHKEHSGAPRPFALPKLNLQYLSLGDFLYRSLVLYRNEAFYGVKNHIEDTIKRLKPHRQVGGVRFDGFSRMAIPIAKPAIIDTSLPRVGQDAPAEVKVEVILDVSRLQPGLRREWEQLRSDDVVYLVSIEPHDADKRLTNGHAHVSDAEKAGLKLLRCAEVISVLDEHSRILKHDVDRQDHSETQARPRQRRLLLRLDAATYKHDKERLDAGKGDVYESINVIIRRRARENNFKSVLDSIRQLAISETPIPAWLQEVFLGYGDPSSASYRRLPNRLSKIDYRDTFLDWTHLVESLPDKTVKPNSSSDGGLPPPYVLETESNAPEPTSRPGKKRRRDQHDGPEPAAVAPSEAVLASTYPPPNTGPYPADAPRLNQVRFTPAQVEAISSGTQPGLSVIVGPPGTGKTDVAVQIINNIYHNFPQQRTLLIAHSNQALNQLFQKIAALDIDERHLLRLGHGEEDLQTDVSFSKFGRIESFMERGARYLAEVQRLSASINAPGAHGNSCETAEYFDHVWLQPRWKSYWDEIESGNAADVVAKFPFHAFFADAPQPLFPSEASKDALTDVAKGCERHMRRMFDELADIRPFEILRSQRDKSNYLLIKEARIIAMTSTHAAMRRQDIAGLGFRYDNVIMEEAAQVTEMESFIPLVMQKPRIQDGKLVDSQLQRVVLVGDHLQNSPVVQNNALRSHANLEQSLFKRLIRLGVPHILLDAQGRSRPSIAALYKWRYPTLTNLPFTLTAEEFVRANAGFRHEYQFIDVPDYKGRGETEPSPYFLQNLGEAEYAVALYQYMRLLGYPASKISMLCAYAGQSALLRDVLAHRCRGNRLFGMPAWVGTVDKYQGEQNDYVILSLVRTKSPGYLRNVRRLTVALSRARLGLYVLGRREVFESSIELREAFALLFERSNKLALVTGEMYPTARTQDQDVEGVEMEGVEHLGQYVYEMTQAKVKALKDDGAALPPNEPTESDTRDVDEDDNDAEEARPETEV